VLGEVIDAKAILVAINMIHRTTVCCKLPECHKQMSSRDLDTYSLACRWHRRIITTTTLLVVIIARELLKQLH